MTGGVLAAQLVGFPLIYVTNIRSKTFPNAIFLVVFADEQGTVYGTSLGAAPAGSHFPYGFPVVGP